MTLVPNLSWQRPWLPTSPPSSMPERNCPDPGTGRKGRRNRGIDGHCRETGRGSGPPQQELEQAKEAVVQVELAQTSQPLIHAGELYRPIAAYCYYYAFPAGH